MPRRAANVAERWIPGRQTATREAAASRREPSLAELAAASPGDRAAMLGATGDGLHEQEAERRLRVYGLNEPVRAAGQHPLVVFAANFTHTLALLLWFAAGLAFASGVPALGGAIVAVVAVNGVFAYLQEYRAERVIASLMQRVAVRARVIRDAQERVVAATELVRGDVVRVSAGDVVPADCVLLSSDGLSIDMSMLTGESLPVERNPAAADVAVGQRIERQSLNCVLPSGAGVVTGSADALVFATGPASTMGQIASMTAGVQRGTSVLERQVSGLSRVTAVLAVIAGTAMLIIANTVTNVGFVTALTFSTGVIVALVPEGLLPTLSVALAIGAVRMASRGAAARRLSAIEAIGAVTVICTDKTGTLTQNALSIVGFVGPNGAAGADPAFLRDVALCNNAYSTDAGWGGDSLDAALLTWAAAQGIDVEAVRTACPRTEEIPFDARHRFMSVTCSADGARVEISKGAPEPMLARARTTATPPLASAIEQATQRGERVLLFTRDEGAGPYVTGLVRVHDPARPEVPAAIAACHRARIRVVMLTGDHPGTARAVAASIGLGGDALEVLDGDQVDRLPDHELLERLSRDCVLARVDPAQKLRIAALLRRAGEIVVVTGDGINDAPALRAADVGVAMGRRGTEVAKQAADVVLSDDNFATIVAAIEEGRSIKANIRRFASYVFTSNVAELVPFAIYVFLGIPLPLAVAQVLAIDLGTDLLPSMALGAEPPSPRTLEAAPEPPSSPLLTPPLFARTFLFFGLIEATLGMAAFLAFYGVHGWRPFQALPGGVDWLDQARALTFLGIVSGQIGCLFAQRDGSLLHRLFGRTNNWIGWSLASEVALVIAVVYIPGVNGLFSMAAVAPAWLLVLPAGAAAFLLLDLARRALAARLAGTTARGGSFIPAALRHPALHRSAPRR